jgi:hypothetical protein
MGIQDLFDDTEVEETSSEGRREMDRVPDGSYKAVVTDFSVFNTESGDYYVSWWFEVTQGPASGSQLQSFSSVGPNSIKFIKRSVKTVIGKFPSWNEMFDEGTGRTGAVRNKVVGADVQITQKTNNSKGKDYVNVYIDKTISAQPKAKKPAPVQDIEDEIDVDDLF